MDDQMNSILLCINLLLILIIIPVPTVLSQERPMAPALLVFGDSIVDTGNNNMIITTVKADFPPYGRDFQGRQPTGRFSNGKMPSDMIASMLGIKDLLPPYYAPDLEDGDLLTGVSFASAGTGYDNLTAVIAQVFSMWDQLEMHKEYRRKLVAIAGEETADAIIRESPHVVFAGNNDILATYFFTTIRQKTFDLPSYINYLVDAATNFVKELYNLGARRIVVFGLPPLGCVPVSRTVRGGKNRDCVDIYNQAASSFNFELSNSLNQINVDLPGSRIIYLGIFDIIVDLIQHGPDYGFEETTKGCCGTGEFEASISCNKFSPCTCPESETNKYIFWDAFHPTERAFHIVTAAVQSQLLNVFR
ncbi:GDSL esterase/lipase EXL3-like [Zingiber officinale]|uniref:GDSL esterase/lipase EXL3-like n=1 Tax=Zingiber officinale TaxID=94328 RepID=UPI001C4AB411|nr:GDSL esterase/lipase EXL3-like [Zingiber officinale]